MMIFWNLLIVSRQAVKVNFYFLSIEAPTSRYSNWPIRLRSWKSSAMDWKLKIYFKNLSLEETHRLLLVGKLANYRLPLFTGTHLYENPRRNKDANQQQTRTQPTYHARSEIQTQATLVRGKCSNHCAIAAPSVLHFSAQKWPYLVLTQKYSM